MRSLAAAIVALLAEGVDRNDDDLTINLAKRVSPSSRRAWIEIDFRNLWDKLNRGRPPRGGRG